MCDLAVGDLFVFIASVSFLTTSKLEQEKPVS